MTDTAPGLLLVDLAVEALLSAQLEDHPRCRRSLRHLTDLAGRWAGAGDLTGLAPPLTRRLDDDDPDHEEPPWTS